jgi:hypothetical protein
VQVKNLRRKSIILGLAAVLIIVIVGGYFGLTYYLGLNQNNAPPNPSVEQVRDMTMAYIKAHHDETAQYMQSFSWTGRDITPAGLVGYTTWLYQSAGWKVTIGYPVVPNPIYSVTATYTSQVTRGEVVVSWQGTFQNGIINETAYNFNTR